MPGPGSSPVGMHISDKIIEKKLRVDASVKTFETKGKEKVKTPAGSFDCYKLRLITETDIMGRSIDITSVIYYSPEAGIVKVESEQMKYKAGYSELTVIKQ